jgi:hypothetical protein
MAITSDTLSYDPPDYGWRVNPFGRAVSPSEARLIQELAGMHRLDVEPRRNSYLFRAPAWDGQVLRVYWGIVCWPRAEVLRAFTKLMDIMPLQGNYAGLYLKRLHGSDLVAFKFRLEQRAKLEA